MRINNLIREQVIVDIAASINSESTRIRTFFNGLPSFIEVPTSEDEDLGDIPALSVSLSDGVSTDDNFEENTWSAQMTIRIYLVATNNIVEELDALGQQVLDVIGTHYTANSLLSNCNRTGYDYGLDEEQPWGTLDYYFKIEYAEEVE